MATRQPRQGGLTNSPHRISDLDSFLGVTGNPRWVAGLYFFSILDCLVDLARIVSRDFFRRPHLYTNLRQNGDNTAPLAPILARLHARYGSDERVLSKMQREDIYTALFGKSGSSASGECDFPRLRNELVNACAAFAERIFDTGEEMLRERVRTTHRPLYAYLRGVEGDSVRWSREEALAALTEEISYPILRNPGVAAIFGISEVPRRQWPYTEDSNADKLVEEVSKQLQRFHQPTEINSAEHSIIRYITREHITNLQRAALRGAEAIATIIDFREGGTDDDLDLLITKCYTWGSALMSLKAYPSELEVFPADGSRAMIGAESPSLPIRKEMIHTQPMLITNNNR